MITGLAHVCLRVKDLAGSLRFYQDGLGLARAFDFYKEDGSLRGVYLALGRNTFIEIFAGTLGERGDAPIQHLCLEVADLPIMVETLTRRGITASEPKLGADGSWQSWILDPDGTRIELHGYTPTSSQRTGKACVVPW